MFHIGQKVLYDNTEHKKTYRTGYDAIRLNRKTGIIVRSNCRSDNAFGVYFEGWKYGHTCGVKDPTEDTKHSYYWINPVYLTPIPTKLLSYEEML